MSKVRIGVKNTRLYFCWVSVHEITSPAPLAPLSSFTMRRGRAWKPKPELFSCGFVKEVDLTVNLLSFFFFYDQKREIYHVGKSQVIFGNARYKAQRAVKNAACLNALELCHWQFAYCCREAGADSDASSPAPSGNFLGSCYKGGCHTDSGTENEIHTATSAPRNPAALDGVQMGGNNAF